mgnify:FL=1
MLLITGHHYYGNFAWYDVYIALFQLVDFDVEI